MTPKEHDRIKADIRRLERDARTAENEGDYDVSERLEREAAELRIILLEAMK